jgi:hypothetical protein
MSTLYFIFFAPGGCRLKTGVPSLLKDFSPLKRKRFPYSFFLFSFFYWQIASELI